MSEIFLVMWEMAAWWFALTILILTYREYRAYREYSAMLEAARSGVRKI
jgi:hypothetical protein